jgi:hypothetical protein
MSNFGHFCLYCNSGINVQFTTDIVMIISVTKTVRIDETNARFKVGTHTYLHGADQTQTSVVQI